MENKNWFIVYYNGLETNAEVTKNGQVRLVKKDWLIQKRKPFRIGEVDFNELKLDHKGYRVISINIYSLKTKMVKVHQLIASAFLEYNFNNFPCEVVNHKNSVKTDNQLDNLEVKTNRGNCSIERTIKKGLPVGVYLSANRKKYKASISINNKNTYLGTFETIEEATLEYQNKLNSILI
jgi:hypothetical protein